MLIPQSEHLPAFMQAAEHPTHRYLKTGLPSLDRMFGGGLPEGLHVWAGSPGSGKTTLAIQVANHAAKNGGDALIFELEMSEEYITARGVSQAAYFDNPSDPANPYAARLAMPNSDEPFTAATVERIRRGAELYARHSDRILVETETAFVGEVWKEVEEYVNAHGTRPLVIVDHLRCLTFAGITDVYEAERAAVAALKSMANKCHVPVILIATTNKGGLKSSETSGMEAVRGSTDISFSADSVAILSRADNGLVTFRTEKNRSGTCGKTSLVFHGEFGVFEDSDDVETPEEIEAGFSASGNGGEVPQWEDLMTEFGRGGR